jgi:tetratricopeptide (TPR) repeat protein
VLVASVFASPPTKTEVAARVEEAARGEQIAWIDSLVEAYPTYRADVTVLLHRQAVDSLDEAGERLRGAAALFAERSSAYGDTLPARIDRVLSSFDPETRDRWRKGERLFVTGIEALQSLKYADADAALDSARAIYEACGDVYREGLATSYLGLSALNRGDLGPAYDFLVTGASLQEEIGDLLGLAATLAYLAQIDEAFGRYDNAVATYEASLSLFRSLGSGQDVAETLQSLANIRAVRGDYRGSLAMLEEALDIHRILANPVGEALARIALGNLRRRFGDFASAGACYGEAGAIIERAQLHPLRSYLRVSQGILQSMIGDPEEAARLFVEAERVDSTLGDEMGVDVARLNRAEAVLEAGRYGDALALAEAVLLSARSRGDPRTARAAHETIGRFHLTLNDLPPAKNSLEGAAVIAREGGEREAEAPILLSLARVRFSLGETDSALTGFAAAADSFRNLGLLPLACQAALEKAGALARMNRFEEAREAALRVREEARGAGFPLQEAEALLVLARVSVEKGRAAEAIEFLDAAERLSVLDGLPRLRWVAWLARGEAEEALGSARAAEASFRKSIETVEEMRSSIRSTRGRTLFLEEKTKPYERLVLLLLKQGREEAAFQAAERARSRALLDLVASTDVLPIGTSEAGSIERERELLAKIARLNEEMEEAANEGDLDLGAERRAYVRKEIEEARGELDRLSDRLVRLDEAARTKLDPPDVSLEKIRGALGIGDLLLAYFFADGRLVIFAVSAGGIRFALLPIEPEEVSDRVRLARSLLSSRETDPARLVPVLTDLRRILLPEEAVGEVAERTGRLIVVPTGTLIEFPFETLVLREVPSASSWEEIPFLGDQWEVVLMPSAVLAARPMRSSLGEEARIALFADPAGEGPALPSARREAKTLERFFAPERRRVLIGKNATERSAKLAFADSDILHFAAHAVWNPIHPLSSSIDLRGGEGEDGRLSVREILGSRVAASFVYLGACRTGIGGRFGGDTPAAGEAFGFAQAFLAAGAETVLSALWPVADRSAEAVASRFYERLLRGWDPVSALAEAKRGLRKEPVETGWFAKEKWDHPAHWAPFVIVQGAERRPSSGTETSGDSK